MHAVAGPTVAGLSVGGAYDAIAASYDEQVSGDHWMRRELHAHYARAFAPGQRVLDVGCGTGIDALFLAHNGVVVVGVDASAAMIARLRERVAAAPPDVQRRITSHVLDIAALDAVAAAPFDGAIGAFASLNTLPDLGGFARAAAGLVRPGGRLVLHLLNRFSLWEWLGCVRRGEWAAARQVGRPRQRPFVIGGQSVEHRVYFAADAYAPFRADFRLRQAYALGWLRPPHTVRRIPRPLARALEWGDVRLGGLPLARDAGRFFVLDLERRAR